MSMISLPLEINENNPPALAPLTDAVISPANIEIEARRKYAERLPFFTRIRLKRELKRLNRELAQFNTLKDDLIERREQLLMLREPMHAIKSVSDTWGYLLLWPLFYQVKMEVWRRYQPLQQAYQARRLQYVRVAPGLSRRDTVQKMLEDHAYARDRERAENKEALRMKKEAQIYEKIIISRWTRLGFAQKIPRKNGKFKYKKVKFAHVKYTLDGHYLKIDGAFQSAMGAWDTSIPEGVYITKHLLHPDTLNELTIACQRQVTGLFGEDGAWVVVHRLEAADGLLNYVSYKDVLKRYDTADIRPADIPLCVGVGQNRLVRWVHLSDFPHWLIGGYTNSGKSNAINVHLCTIITKQSPDNIRLLLIDLKGGLEFGYYAGVPHLLGEIVDSLEQVADRFAELEAIMYERFRKFKGVAKKIEDYRLMRPNDPMPRILCVFDEIGSVEGHGDLSKRIQASLRELTRMGRAVGISIWPATQRPDVKAIDGSIKANLSLRLSGRMTTSADSVTILGNSDAKNLAPIQGRMVLQIGPDPEQIQTPHITHEDIEEALMLAHQWPIPKPITLPDGIKRIVHQQWNVERVVELIIKHLNGNCTADRVYKAAEGLSQSQARAIVEDIWTRESVEFDGKLYRMKPGKGHKKTLVEIGEVVEF